METSKKDFALLLSSLKSRTDEVQQSITILEHYATWSRSPEWPKILARFTTLSGQLQKLQEELMRPATLSRLENSVPQPCVDGFDPTIILRTRPLPQFEEQDAQLAARFQSSAEVQLDVEKLKGNTLQYNAEVCTLVQLISKAKTTAEEEGQRKVVERKDVLGGLTKDHTLAMLKPKVDSMNSGKRLRSS
eukprot:gb/GEZN01011232.1/.p1 GENE.gb/GEZN01011232.1/~~gb/GEZN01011232.1/.p1  ORF type:complete len:190 (-),score=35.16 gb/GEZN01011232.1/:553-1122(-)